MGDGTMVRAFHEATKHSYASVRLHRHALDGSNRPFPFQVYEGLERVPLMREPPRLGGRAMDAVGTVEVADPAAGPDLSGLDEVTAFFSPDAAGRSCILVVALGESVRRMLPLA